MGSTGKIYFGCFIAVSIVVTFLLFSMQNSAQLKLDIQDIQNSVSVKDRQINTLSNDLDSAQTSIKRKQEQERLISELKGHVQTREDEKLVLNQQLAEFQTQLKNQIGLAEKRLAEIATLQEQQQVAPQVVVKEDNGEAKAAAEKQKAAFTAALQLTKKKIEKSEQALVQVVETLEEKDRVILMCKANLSKIAGEMNRIQSEDSYDMLNLNLILDELATKANIVSELTFRLEEAERSIMQVQRAGHGSAQPAAVDTEVIIMPWKRCAGQRL